jgi:GNAT superfamily N-acetyltransferase
MAGATSKPQVAARSASANDGPAAVDALARAFWSDPFLVHFYPDETMRARRIHRFFRILWKASLPLGYVEVTDRCEAVALWRPPNRWRIEWSTIARNIPAILLAYGSATARVIRCLAAMEKHHPRQPHWYLATVGTDPMHQGHGLAGRLIRSRLARCDAAGEAAYLEAASEDLVPFYGGMGFRQLGEVTVPDGPVFHPMWRDPA